MAFAAAPHNVFRMPGRLPRRVRESGKVQSDEVKPRLARPVNHHATLLSVAGSSHPESPHRAATFLPDFASNLGARESRGKQVLGMTVQSGSFETNTAQSMPGPLDSETAMLLRSVLLPHFECAQSWGDLCRRLAAKGYEITFRNGHLVLTGEGGRPVCTGAMIGSPLSALADRLGRPKLRSDCSGSSAVLQR
jgi:hypothetical protein